MTNGAGTRRIARESSISGHDRVSRPLAQGPFEARGLGELWLVWSERGLVELRLPHGKKALEPRPDAELSDVPELFRNVLGRYFDGAPVEVTDLPVDLRGTPFQLRVWNALRTIPRGTVRSYAGVARDVRSPRAMRAVGTANSNNPVAIVVPCHRVVQSGFRLGGYSGGLDTKRLLLQLEGVIIDQDRLLPGQLELST